jgi:tRNA 2-thiouridine synthesizing protein B
MLHTMNKSPFERNTFATCLAHLKKGHALLLIEDGVYAATQGTDAAKKLQEAMKTVQVYALQPDVEARGLQSRVLEGVKLVDFGGFVDLAAEHPTVQSWL